MSSASSAFFSASSALKGQWACGSLRRLSFRVPEAADVSSDKNDRESRAWARTLRDVGPYLGIGATLAVTVLLGVGIGHWLDGRLGTRPAFVVAGAMVGLAAAGYHFYRLGRVKR